MARPNPHGEAALEPSAYSFEFWFDNQPWRDLPGWEHPDVIQAVRKMRQRVEEKRDLLRDRSTSVYKPHGRCAHCGNWIRYHVVLRDRRDDAGYLGGSMGPMQSTIDSLREPEEIALLCIDCGDVHDAVQSLDELPYPENVEDRGDGPQVERGRCPFCRGEDQP